MKGTEMKPARIPALDLAILSLVAVLSFVLLFAAALGGR
jgi:hypothetical protein